MLNKLLYFIISLSIFSNSPVAWALSPASTLPVQGSLTLEQAEWDHLKLVFNDLQETIEPDLFNLPEDFFYGEVSSPSLTDLAYPKGRNIYALAHLEASFPMLLSAQNIPDTNFFIIPSPLNNLFIQNGKLFCHYAIFMNREGKLCYGKFKQPLQLHSGFHSDLEDSNLEEIRFPTLNGSEITQLTENKISIKKLMDEAGIPTPKWFSLNKKDLDGDEKKIKERIRALQALAQNNSFVIKPHNRSQGIGVRLFSQLNGVLNYLENLFTSSDQALIEERIEPFQVIDSYGVELDFNIRSFVTFDPKKGPITTGMIIRKGFKTSRPVNGAQGAESYSFDQFFKEYHLNKSKWQQLKIFILNQMITLFNRAQFLFENQFGRESIWLEKIEPFFFKHFEYSANKTALTPNQIEQLKTKIEQLSVQTAKAIQDKLKQSSSKQQIGFLGLDIIIDQNLNPYVLEVNSGNVGGIPHWITLHQTELSVIAPVTQHLIHLAQQNHSAEQAPLETKVLEGNKKTSWALLGGHYREQAKFKNSEAALRTALSIAPKDATVLFWLATVLADQNKLAEAIKFYKKALSLDPLNSNIAFGLAISYMEQENRQKAKQTLETQLNLVPDNTSLLTLLGQTLIQLEEWDSALAVFTRLKEISHLNPQTWYYLGLIYLSNPRGNHSLAALYFNRSLQADPEYRPALLGLRKIEKFYFENSLNYLERSF